MSMLCRQADQVRAPIRAPIGVVHDGMPRADRADDRLLAVVTGEHVRAALPKPAKPVIVGRTDRGEPASLVELLQFTTRRFTQIDDRMHHLAAVQPRTCIGIVSRPICGSRMSGDGRAALTMHLVDGGRRWLPPTDAVVDA